uniref:Epidermal growth factor receptor kinase substrate 8-like protein 1 n=1 Tax=Geotrypetes seraphini TaxID=260995 RepID=A0A6P8SDG7_GEOSA|nr:epidermal growth factor receptor kinase substrate 8-like protein 1 isoform X2 [Geotrypetes seraphini]
MSSPAVLNGLAKPSARSIYEQRKRYSNFVMADVSQYQVNHLVTFTIDEDDDVHTVEDAIRKLSAMDTKGKIWTQEMLLQVSSNSVKLLDVESKEELENYLLTAIKRCDTVVPERRSHSLLLLVCQDTYQPNPDVHFFQCQQVGAELIKEDIGTAVSDLKSGEKAKRPEALRLNKEVIEQNSIPSRLSPMVAPGTGPFSYSPYTQRRTLVAQTTDPQVILERDASRRPPVYAAVTGKSQQSVQSPQTTPSGMLQTDQSPETPRRTQDNQQLEQSQQSAQKPQVTPSGTLQKDQSPGSPRRMQDNQQLEQSQERVSQQSAQKPQVTPSGTLQRDQSPGSPRRAQDSQQLEQSRERVSQQLVQKPQVTPSGTLQRDQSPGSPRRTQDSQQLEQSRERVSQQLAQKPQVTPNGTLQRDQSPRSPRKTQDSQQLEQRRDGVSPDQMIVDGISQEAISLRAERDVDILNHTFDDIENFIGKLHKSSEAYKVLDQRKKSRRTKKKEAGEGLLTLRAKPPTIYEYTDVLQKFKYCFSLLAKLKNNITNPSSVELVHFLFGPLKTTVESSGGVELAADIRSPMLTKEAVSLLRENLNEQEMGLWMSLGPNWTKPRVEFPRDYAEPYVPGFRSGWQPPQEDSNGQPWEDPVELQHRHEELRSQQSAPQVLQPASDPTINGHGDTHHKCVSCTYDFVARNSNELSVLQGEILEVIDDSKKWWKVQNRYGQLGYVPYNILTPVTTEEPEQLKVNPDDAESTGQQVKKNPPPIPPKKPVNMKPHVQWESSETLNRDSISEKDKLNQINIMNEELLIRLANGRTAPQKTFSVQRTLDTSIPLSDESGPAEVKAWLEAKGFNSLTVNSFGVLNGAQLFSLQKDEFKAVSPEEGARVYSQVMVQKSFLEDSRKISELEAVMEKQKKKVDSEMEE